MGRQPDPPGLQAAKGHPGKRPKTVKARERELLRVAKLLVETPAEAADVLAPPAFLDKRFPGALQVWRNLAPRLKSTHRLQATHRPIFAMFCVYFAEWLECNEDIGNNGHTQTVETVAGGSMERIRPSVRMREIAFDNVMKLSANFGLTPTDEYSLFKDQRLAALNNGGLFDDQDDKAAAAEEEQDAGGDQVERAQARSLIGCLGAADSQPPGKPN